MAWIWFGTKPIALILIVLAWPSQSSAQGQCCKRIIASLPTGEFIPPECSKNVKCTEGPVIVEETDSQALAVYSFLISATKTGTLSVIKNSKRSMGFPELIELLHSGKGPAISLDHAKLDDTSFEKLKTLTVENLQPYCDGAELIDIQGPLDATVKKRLDKILNETLAPCESLKGRGSFGVSGQNNLTCSQCTAKLAAAESKDADCSSTAVVVPCVIVIVLLAVAFGAMTFIAFGVRKSASASVSASPANRKSSTGSRQDLSSTASAENPNKGKPSAEGPKKPKVAAKPPAVKPLDGNPMEMGKASGEVDERKEGGREMGKMDGIAKETDAKMQKKGSMQMPTETIANEIAKRDKSGRQVMPL
ncbi:unnamed protein product [Caenorhabditis auriculariae]|uniref:Receptor L-domain domain-containing protein n=1 Tax=Caenorhabditis auriculariae TaxID=2777116 RepID=A0A8S1HJB6_9PELO|nr:unnamed protein product [Caenorhabditis auriculariae]